MPPECDVSIRPGWFWHKNETAKPLPELLEVYYNSVGRNCVLLLNAPPNTTGLVDAADIARLREFRTAVTAIFGTDLAAGSAARASSSAAAGSRRPTCSTAATTRTGHRPRRRRRTAAGTGSSCGRPASAAARKFNVVRIQEHVAMGQRVERHEVYVDGGGAAVASGTTVGHKRLHRLGAPWRGGR